LVSGNQHFVGAKKSKSPWYISVKMIWRVWFQNAIHFCVFEKNAVKVWNLLGNALENF
jgi:hypothetical protein